jgi:ADP-ribosylglycohydrolase
MKRPIPNSYWVEPGVLLAGEHPDGGDEESTRERIESLVAAGVRSFIDLTQPGEIDSYQHLLPAGVSYHAFPMPDHSVPDTPDVMHDVQALLEQRLGSRRGVYVHCRAGIGRTGMAIGCYLREQGESAEPALTELNRLWKQNARAARWPSIPETEEQEDFIRQWSPSPLDKAVDGNSSGLHRLQARPLERYRGCLVALAVGEVLSGESAPTSPAPWAENTGQVQCVAESLLEITGFDGRDQLDRFRLWEKDPADMGAAPNAKLPASVRTAMTRALWSRAQVTGSHDPAQIDSAPLTRCAAPALFALGNAAQASSLGADVARVTHQAPVLVDACRLFTCMITAALSGRSRKQVLLTAADMQGLPLRDEVRDLARYWGEVQAAPRRSQPQGILGALDRAVRSFAKTRDFGAGMARALAHRGADRALISSAYGALAGAYYGEAAIPVPMVAQVAGVEHLQELADRLYLHGRAHDTSARIP